MKRWGSTSKRTLIGRYDKIGVLLRTGWSDAGRTIRLRMEGEGLRAVKHSGSYVKALHSGVLESRAGELMSLLSDCTVCPHECHVDRTRGEVGVCSAGEIPEISGYAPHFGEEPPLVGTGGSGTIFFSHCNLACVFCQNYETSRALDANPVTLEALASIMLALERRGCHNINLVTPSHYVPQIVEAVRIAASKGLSVPLVYNSGGYDSVATLQKLEGIVDIYMPDFKYSSNEAAKRLSGVGDYVDVAKAAIKEMHRQVGDLVVDERGVAIKGLIIRHLVLPGGLAGSEEVLRFIAEEVSPSSYVNIMDQYYPAHDAFKFPELSRRVPRSEFDHVVALANKISPRFRLA